MILTVCNFKGGVAKTLISSFIGFDDSINATIYTNDSVGIYQQIFPNRYIYADDLNSIDISTGENIIFDLGGFGDDIGKLLSQSDVILIPTLSDMNSIKVCLDTVAEIQEYNQNILVVESLYKSGSFLDEAISENFDSDIPILKLRYSKVFDNALRAEKSVHEFIQGDKLKQITYKNVFGDMRDIIEVVKILGGLNE